ncbi:MAG TPA: HDOD domain-containing protein [Candidatus Aquilonibacter sp.]|jgi:c-di-GMP-related signal transduction protein|nr:HDOD domain-containing protein [Candidatus Aquilonibacter sp.]
MNTAGQALAEKPKAWLARQPILTKDGEVFGYELLYRASVEATHFESDAENATYAAIDTLNVLGLDVVCDGRLAFINCTHEMLLKDYFLLLPPDKVVIEVQETVPADESVLAACQRFKQKQYRIALDNFLPTDPREPLIPFVDFIKVDIRRNSPEQNTAIAKRYADKHLRMVAQKVETGERMLAASKDGFTLFQGYYFQRPEKMQARHIPSNQAQSLRLLQAVSASEPDLKAVEELIKHDASLCYRFLRYLNSPLLGLRSPVESVGHGMSLLGGFELARFIRAVTILAMGQEKCSDLILSSLVRAKFCEALSAKIDHGKSDLFLMGMLSIMDSILGVPMGVVVDSLPLDPSTKAELLEAKIGRDSRLTPIYRLMLARELGDWEDVTVLAKKLNLSLPFVNRSYNDAMVWARELTVGVSDRQK